MTNEQNTPQSTPNTTEFSPIIRTIQKATQMIKDVDPHSDISEFLIRKLANSQKIRSIKTGAKVMVDYDSLIACISGQSYPYPPEQISA